jgi:hypothetical protein
MPLFTLIGKLKEKVLCSFTGKELPLYLHKREWWERWFRREDALDCLSPCREQAGYLHLNWICFSQCSNPSDFTEVSPIEMIQRQRHSCLGAYTKEFRWQLMCCESYTARVVPIRNSIDHQSNLQSGDTMVSDYCYISSTPCQKKCA